MLQEIIIKNVESICTLKDCQGRTEVVCYVKLREVPDEMSLSPNVRIPNSKAPVAKQIAATVQKNSGNFHFVNRGLTMNATKVMHDPTDNTLHIWIDPETQGIVDGGHTSTVIQEYKSLNFADEVKLSIMTGVDDIITDIAKGLNSSTKVDDRSIANAAGDFEPLKKLLDNLVVVQDLSFKQGQPGMNILHLLAALYAVKNDGGEGSMTAYASKHSILEYYLKDPDDIAAYAKIAQKVINLWDEIQRDMPAAYTAGKRTYKKCKFSGYKDTDPEVKMRSKSKFMKVPMEYKVPDALVFPILGAFRNMIAMNDNGVYEWVSDPSPVWGKLRKKLSIFVVSQANSSRSTSEVGRNKAVWEYCSHIVKVELMKEGLLPVQSDSADEKIPA